MKIIFLDFDGVLNHGIRQILLRHGFVGSVIGKTPRLHRTPDGVKQTRGDEIQAWLDTARSAGQNVESFVILDDDGDMAHLKDRLVQTSMATGIQRGHVERAVAMLGARA